MGAAAGFPVMVDPLGIAARMASGAAVGAFVGCGRGIAGGADVGGRGRVARIGGTRCNRAISVGTMG